MTIFFLPFILFAVGFAAHIAIWRLKRPRATGQTLIVTMVASILGGAALLKAVSEFMPGLAPLLPDTLAAWTQTIIAALSFAAAYVMTYPAMEAESPTLVMIDLITKAEPKGLTREELLCRLDDEFLVIPRVDDLVREGLATEADQRIRLTGKGLQLEQMFTAWRRLLSAGIGG